MNSMLRLFKDTISGTSALIIDIRDNNGGNSIYADLINCTLTPDSITCSEWKTPHYIAAYASWGMPVEPYKESKKRIASLSQKYPNHKHYPNPVAVLVNGTTFSSAEMFALVFRGMNRGLIIGTPTGGSSGNSINIPLGYGYTAHICTQRDVMIDGKEFNGTGIIPDIIVHESADMFTGNDPVIETAVEELKKRLR